MGINREAYDMPALKRDVGGLAINGALALFEIAEAFEAIRGGKAPTAEQVQRIRKAGNEFVARFNELSGWADE